DELERDITQYVSKTATHVENLVEGLCVIVMDKDKNCRRALILEVINDEEIKLFLADSGNSVTSGKKQLFSIRDDFLTRLPFQGIKCKFDGVEFISDML